MRRIVPLLAVLASIATSEPPKETATESDPPGELQRFTTCGDPVCGGYSGPFTGIPVCSSEVEGEACATEGEQCDLETDCNTFLICTEEDPKAQVGGCPISRARYKEDIHYLDSAELNELHEQLMGTKLATWRYRWGDHTRVGFIIDDQPSSPAVTPDGERVDLYGYSTLTAASLQVQQGELELLRAELELLRAEVSELKATCAP